MTRKANLTLTQIKKEKTNDNNLSKCPAATSVRCYFEYRNIPNLSLRKHPNYFSNIFLLQQSSLNLQEIQLRVKRIIFEQVKGK